MDSDQPHLQQLLGYADVRGTVVFRASVHLYYRTELADLIR